MPRRKKVPSEITPELSFALKAFEIMAWMKTNPRESISTACKQFGINPDEYSRWVASSQEALQIMQGLVIEAETNQLMRLSLVTNAIMDRLIRDALLAETEPQQRLMILQYLEAKQTALQQKYQPAPTGISNLLVGPKVEEVSSRFVGAESKVEDDGSVTVKLTPGKIIELPPDAIK